METTALRVSEYTIRHFNTRKQEITNLKLQKLLYYSQAWFLAIYGKPLFRERIEAWVHGPAVPPVFGEFKSYKWNSIDRLCNEATLPASCRAHVDEVLGVYGGFGPKQLEILTHREDPWREARAGLSEVASSHNVISHESMKRYYRKLLHGK